jgi:O-antigen/teichoic acid export membrane protein
MEMKEIAPPVAAAAGPLQEFDGCPLGSSRGKSILLNFGSLSVGALVSRLMGLATNAVLARRVSAAGFGVAGIAQSATSYFNLISDLGLGTVAIREGAQNPRRLQQVISAIIGLRLVVTAVLVPLGFLTALYLPYSDEVRNMFRVYVLTLPIQALTVEWVFRAVQKMYLNTALQIASALLTLILTVALVRQPRDLNWIAGTFALATGVAVALGIYFLRREGFRAWPSFSPREYRYLVAQSIPLCLGSIAVTLYAQTNNLILGALRGDAEVGLYVAASKLGQVCYYPIWLYFAAMAPALMEAWAFSPVSARSLLSTSVRTTAIISIGSGLVASCISQWAITLLFGKGFQGASAAFNILVWTGVIVAIGHNWDELCVAARRNRLFMQSTFLGAFVNLAVCAATVSRIGTRGAALGNMMAEIAAHVFLLISFGWDLGLSVLRVAARPALAGAGAYGISFLIRPSGPAFSAALTGLSYLGLLFLVGGITMRDLNRLRSLIPLLRCAPGSLS